MLWVGGLFDAEDNWGAWNSYLSAETYNPGKDFNKLVIGPWYHGEWATADGTRMGNIQFGSNTADWYQQNIEIPFFNYYLKNEGNIDSLPEINIFFTGTNEWRSFSQWPPAGSGQKYLYLTDSGQLTWDRPVSKKSFSEYISDPWKPVPYIDKIHFNRTQDYLGYDQRFAERRPDVLSFKTGELSDDISIAGDVMADLMVSLSTTDADFIVKLIDVFPDRLTGEEQGLYAGKNRTNPYLMGGYEMPVRIEIMRGRFRKSPEKPEPFVPGKMDEVKFSLGHAAHTFKKGHRIMVQIQSTWFPLVDINPQKFVDIYRCSDKDFQKSEIRIFHEREASSHVTLPVLNK